MPGSKVVDEYLKVVKHELYGMDSETSKATLEELRGYIDERANDIASQRNMDTPDDKIYQEVIKKLGPPNDVVVEYLKVPPRRIGTGLRLFLVLQSAIGLVSLLLGIDQLAYSNGLSLDTPSDASFKWSMVITSLIFSMLGAVTIIAAWLQLTRPKYIAHYGAISGILSLSLSAAILFSMVKVMIWRYSEEGISDARLFSIVAPIFLSLVFGYLLGFRVENDFQRRFAIEDIDEEFHILRKKSSKVLIAVSIALILLIAGIGFNLYNFNPEITEKNILVGSESVGGPTDARIEHWKVYQSSQWFDTYKILYTYDGVRYSGNFLLGLRLALNWIENSTVPNSTFLGWWDYGHSIRGYASRSAVIYSPSRSLANTIINPDSITEWTNETTVRDVALALVSTNVSETIRIMEEYHSRYLISSYRDTSEITYAIFQAAGLNINDYIKSPTDNPLEQPTEKGKQTLLYRIWAGTHMPGLELVYSDIDTRIFMLSE